MLHIILTKIQNQSHETADLTYHSVVNLKLSALDGEDVEVACSMITMAF